MWLTQPPSGKRVFSLTRKFFLLQNCKFLSRKETAIWRNSYFVTNHRFNLSQIGVAWERLPTQNFVSFVISSLDPLFRINSKDIINNVTELIRTNRSDVFHKYLKSELNLIFVMVFNFNYPSCLCLIQEMWFSFITPLYKKRCDGCHKWVR